MTSELPPDSDDEGREWFADPTGRYPYRAKQYGIWSDLATDGSGGPPVVDEAGGDEARRPQLTGSANLPWRSVDDIVGSSPESPGVDGPATDPSTGKRNRVLLIAGAVAALVAVAVVAFVVLGRSGSDDDTTGDESAGSAQETTTTTEAPTTTVATTTTSEASTSTVPLPAPTPRSFSGTGDQMIDLGGVVSGPYLVKVSHNGTSNFKVSLLDDSGNGSQGLVNTIGAYDGSVPANFAPGDQFDYIDVRADGPWTVDLLDLLNAPVASTQPGQTYDGSGDQVVFFNATARLAAQITCDNCEGTFRVVAWGDERNELVNETGAYDERVVIPAGTEVLQVSASPLRASPRPVWSITPE